jgi:cell division protein FtsL
MSAVAEGPRVKSRRAQRARRRPMTGGVLWIAAVGALLAGIVAINVFVLQLNVQLDQLGRERAQLKADIAGARAQLSTASANVRIESEAASKLGLAPADPGLTRYVTVGTR